MLKHNLNEILKQLEARPKFDGAKLNITEREWKDFYIELGFWYQRLEEKIVGFEKKLRERLAYVRRMEKEGLEEDRDKFVWERETYKEILGDETP
jgi:hypothetical protein